MSHVFHFFYILDNFEQHHACKQVLDKSQMEGKHKVNLDTKKGILYCRQVCIRGSFCALLFTNVQKTRERAQNTKPKQRLRLGRLGFRPNIALSWFWQVINGKLCCIDINHNWVFISPVPNLFLHETWVPVPRCLIGPCVNMPFDEIKEQQNSGKIEAWCYQSQVGV